MIQAMIFDLDGTLVQTERLKALSYAQAAVELCPDDIQVEDVIEAFKDFVGLSRREVAQGLMERFHLQAASEARMAHYGVAKAWQAFVQTRLEHYGRLLADPDILRQNRWQHNLALLETARRTHCKVGLATMSHCEQARRVLKVLELEDAFDFVATRDDVSNGKPDPEIYLLVATELGVHPADCLVVEDSPAGVKAALAAGMTCVAVTTPFTRVAMHSSGLLAEEWIVDDPAQLDAVVNQAVTRHAH